MASRVKAGTKRWGTLGFGLVEVMVAGAMLGALALGFARFASLASKQQSGGITVNKFEEVRSIYFSILRNNAAWLSTINDPVNAAMACLKNATNCAGLPAATANAFQGNDASGNPILGYRPLASPTNGFNSAGIACNSFVAPPAQGNDLCPFRLDMTWRPICPAAGPCINPQVMVDGSFIYNPGTPSRQIAFNGGTTGHGFRLVAGGPMVVGGPTGTFGCSIITSTAQSGSAYSTTVIASCVAGTTLTGGGCNMVSYVGGFGTGGAANHRAYPQGNSFVCQAAWGAGAGQNPIAYAICCG